MWEVKDKATAIKRTRLAQGLFAIAGGSAVAIAFVGGPKADGVSPAAYTPPELPPINAGGAKASAPVDSGALSARMALIGNPPQPIPPAPPPLPVDDHTTGKGPDAAPAPAPPSDDVIKYLGPVRLGARTMALLSIHGKQRFVSVDEKTDDGTVSEITGEHVKLVMGEVTRTIERSARGSDVLTKVSSVARAPTVPGARPGMPPRPASFVQPQPTITPGMNPGMNPGMPSARTDPAAAFDNIRTQLKASGKFEDEGSLDKAAKEELERQITGVKPPGGKGGK